MSMCDAYDMWRYREREQELKLEKLPTCCRCQHKIQSDALFDIDGRLYHEECAIEEYRKWTEDYET